MLTIAARESAGRLQKPSSVVRRAACRLPWAWDALIFACPLNVASDEGLREVAQDVAPIITGGTVWTEDGRGNPAVELDNVSYIEWPNVPPHDGASTALTVHVRCMRVGTPANFSGIISNAFGDRTAATWAIYDEGATTSVHDDLGGVVQINSVQSALSGGPVVGISATEFTNLFLFWRSGQRIKLRAYTDDGVLIDETNEFGGVSGTITYGGGQGIRLNRQEAGCYQGVYSQAMVWSRQLSDTEMVALVADPFGWYAPRRETLVFGSAFPLFASPDKGSAGYPATGANSPMF